MEKVFMCAKAHTLPCVAKTKGFSLTELLMGLLVVSILMIAMTPVITKKYNDKINVKGEKKYVYLEEPGTYDWTPPAGVREFIVTSVGAGGGGGAGTGYGCVVFTTNSIAQGSILADDSYCTHVRGDGNINFTIPEGVEEVYVSMVAGAGGGASGKAKWIATDINHTTAGTYNWSVPSIVKGNKVLVQLLGAGGGGGGTDQGGSGGGASGGWVNWVSYNVATNRTTIPIVIGGGGGGGFYRWNSGFKGGGGYNGGQDGTQLAGGGGGGATTFDGDAISAYGGGGGAGSPQFEAGWYSVGIWENTFNYGGSGRIGGTSGPAGSYGGKSGGDGGAGGGVAAGGKGQDGTVGADGRAIGASRGGVGGGKFTDWSGAGGKGQDYAGDLAETYLGAGGAGGGGGGSALSAGGSAFTSCYGPLIGEGIRYPQAGSGAGGAGGSCGWNKGAQFGGKGGDGVATLRYLIEDNGGTGGQAGPVLPRSRIALNSSMKAGHTLTINVGKGGIGGDAVVVFANGDSTEIRTINTSAAIAPSTNITAAHGTSGTQSSLVFNSTYLARTGSGGCGGGYSTGGEVIGPCGGYGTTSMNGTYRKGTGGWHGHQLGACSGDFQGTPTSGGQGAMLVFDSVRYCGAAGGSSSSRNGMNASIGTGGGGGYPTGRGAMGGDGYVKIEWGVPRNLDKTAAQRYSGGGGSAGETISKVRVRVPVLTKTIRYTIGQGGEGAKFNSATSKFADGLNGGNTVFGADQAYQVLAKGGLGGKSAKVVSTIDSFSSIQTLSGAHGVAGATNCTSVTNCPAALVGKVGTNSQGGRGGASNTGQGGGGGTSGSVNGVSAASFDGVSGGGGGGGGGTSGNSAYGQGGKGANGYLKIEWE